MEYVLDLLNEIITWLANSIWQLIAIVIALMVGRWFAHKFRNRLHNELVKRDAQQSLINLSDTVAPYVIWFLVVLVILILLGVPVQPLIFAAAIIIAIIAIAMRESLVNLSATINFWLFKPFETGHVIETGFTLGTVHEIEIFTTVIHAFDNKVHVLPNGLIQANGLINYSLKEALRVDLVFSISYGADVDKAMDVIAAVLSEDDRVLEDPAPLIFVKNLNESAVDIAVRPYVANKDYWQFQFDIVGQVKHNLEGNGFTIPFPQQDVHFYPASP